MWPITKKQRNLVVASNRQAKKFFLSKSPEPSKSFWKSIKPFFKNVITKERILLVDNDNFVRNDKEIVSIFNIYFNRITETLELPEIPQLRQRDRK